MNPAWLLDAADLENLKRGIGLTFSLGGETVTLLLARTRPVGSQNGSLAMPAPRAPRAPRLNRAGRRITAKALAAQRANAVKARAALAKKVRAARREANGA